MWARRGEVCIWLGLAVLSMVWTYRAHDAHKHTLVRQIRPGQRIRWAAHYLASSCDAQGKFRYLARANGMHHPEAHSYDLTHHAWVVSSLAQYCLYEGSGADTHSAAHLNDVPLDVSDVLLRSATYLVTHLRPASESEGSTSLSPSSLSKTMAEAVALWKPRTDGSVEAHCHGAAMALSALVLADRAVGGGVVDLRLLRSLGTFVVEMQQRNGLFYHTAVVHPHRDLSKAAPAAVFEGQTSHGGLASFALLLLADLDREHIDTYRMPGSSWLKPAVRALMGTALEDERMRHYKVQFRTPSHHWYAIAAAEMLRHDAPYLNRSTLPDWYVFSDHFGSVEWSVHDIRTRVTQHTARLLQGMLTHYELLPRQHHEEVFELHGALTSNGEAFLTAQRLRSMHAGLCMLPQRRQEHTDISPPDRDVQREHEMLRERLERAAKKAAAYLSSLQVTPSPTHLVFGHVFWSCLANHACRSSESICEYRDSSPYASLEISETPVSRIQSCPENPLGNFVLPYGKTKTFVGTDLVVLFRFGGLVGYSAQDQWFDALQWGEWQAGQPVVSAGRR